MPAPPRTFLVVDDNADSRFLLVKTLARKFPDAVLHETSESTTAQRWAQTGQLDAVILHRAADLDGVALVRLLRAENASLPLVMVSGIDRSQPAAEAGANAFLHYDAWLRIGTLVAELLDRPADAKSGSAKSAPS